MEHNKTVKDSYNAIATEYLNARARNGIDMQLLTEFMRQLPENAQVLDAGCGAGIPVALTLSESFTVVGVDFSEKQIGLARSNVPGATFFCQDMTQLDFPAESFDGICSFYAIIHIPRGEHRALLESFYRMLKLDGLALLCLGAEDLPEAIEEDYHGHRMVWSHFNPPVYEAMLKDIGFEILSVKIVPDETYGGEHLFVLARKGNASK